MASGTLTKRLRYDPPSRYDIDANPPVDQPTSWTVYVDGIYEQHSDGSTTKYYQAFGRSIAMRTTPAAGGATVNFLLADHLGGTAEVLDATGATVSETKYWPFGSPRAGGITQTDKLFTGQREEAVDVSGLGLYNYKARFYSTVLTCRAGTVT